MNDIARSATADKFSRAMEHEKLTKAEAGACIGFMPPQVSYIFNEKYWPRLGPSGWETLLRWVNSGQTLKEYSEKHGKVLPEKPVKHIELPPKVIAVKPAEIKPIKVTPENKEKVETAERLSKHPYFTGEQTVNSSKICIDIEINLIINGKKITL